MCRQEIKRYNVQSKRSQYWSSDVRRNKPFVTVHPQRGIGTDDMIRTKSTCSILGKDLNCRFHSVLYYWKYEKKGQLPWMNEVCNRRETITNYKDWKKRRLETRRMDAKTGKKSG